VDTVVVESYSGRKEGGIQVSGTTIVCLLCGAELDIEEVLADDGDEVDLFVCPRCDHGGSGVLDPDGAHVAA
jgi:hypothetical protein